MTEPPSPGPPAAAANLSYVDHAWLRMDDPTNLMIINGVLVLDRPTEFERIRSVLERRLLPIPRFRHRIVRTRRRGKPRWEIDPHFDLDRHVTSERLPGAGDQAALQDLVSGMMSAPFDPDRPPWEFHFIENYDGGAAVIGRFHHCIGDGIALLLVLLALTELEGDAAEGGASAAKATNPFLSLFSGVASDLAAAKEATQRVMPEGMKLLLKPVEALERSRRWLVNTAATGAVGRIALRRNDPKTVFKGRLGVPKRAAWSRPIPLEEIRRLKDQLGCTLNDLLLNAMTGGLRRYMLRRGEVADGISFRAAVPVNLRPLEQMADLGNRFGLIFLPLPVGIADPVERLAELQRRMEALKRSAQPVGTLGFLGALGRASAGMQRGLVRYLAGKVTAVMTNVPGPTKTLFLGGTPVREIFFWVPQSGQVGLGVSILSYAGKVILGVVTDQGLVPEPERIVEDFHEELDQMRSSAPT